MSSGTLNCPIPPPPRRLGVMVGPDWGKVRIDWQEVGEMRRGGWKGSYSEEQEHRTRCGDLVAKDFGMDESKAEGEVSTTFEKRNLIRLVSEQTDKVIKSISNEREKNNKKEVGNSISGENEEADEDKVRNKDVRENEETNEHEENFETVYDNVVNKVVGDQKKTNEEKVCNNYDGENEEGYEDQFRYKFVEDYVDLRKSRQPRMLKCFVKVHKMDTGLCALRMRNGHIYCPKCMKVIESNEYKKTYKTHGRSVSKAQAYKHHLLTHFEEAFFETLPHEEPFLCPSCGQNQNTRTALLRHYAFEHQAFYKLTGTTPAQLEVHLAKN